MHAPRTLCCVCMLYLISKLATPDTYLQRIRVLAVAFCSPLPPLRPLLTLKPLCYATAVFGSVIPVKGIMSAGNGGTRHFPGFVRSQRLTLKTATIISNG